MASLGTKVVVVTKLLLNLFRNISEETPYKFLIKKMLTVEV